ncbi:MAG: transporter [Sphingomonadales bacterium]|jgi:hypothetical protein
MTYKNKSGVAGLAAIFAFALVTPGMAEDGDPEPRVLDLIDQVNFYGGIDYSEGDYGSDVADTEIFYAYGSAEVELDRFRARVTIPWIDIEGPGGVTGGPGDSIIVGPGSTIIESNSGLGDIILEGGYLFGENDSPFPFVELVGKIKLPTADEDEGLGTGKTDFTVQADLFKQYEQTTLFGTIGYKIFGDPDGFNLNNTVFTSIGVSQKLNDQFSVGGAFDWREATSEFSEDIVEFSPFASWRFTDNWRFTGYGVIGFSDGSPDLGGGLALKYAY